MPDRWGLSGTTGLFCLGCIDYAESYELSSQLGSATTVTGEVCARKQRQPPPL